MPVVRIWLPGFPEISRVGHNEWSGGRRRGVTPSRLYLGPECSMMPNRGAGHMRELVRRYFDRDIDRRGFVREMGAMGFTLAAAKAMLAPLEASERAAVNPETAGAAT